MFNFIIGVVVGAVLAVTVPFVYKKASALVVKAKAYFNRSEEV